MTQNDPSRPPRLHARGEFALFYTLLAFVCIIGVFDLAGATTNWLDEGNFAFLGPTSTLHFIGHVLIHGGDPASGWHAALPATFPAVAFWSVLAVIIAATTIGGWWLRRRFVGKWRPPIEDGFASFSALVKVASFEAAAGIVRQRVRPAGEMRVERVRVVRGRSPRST